MNNKFATCEYGRPCTGYFFQTVIGRDQNLMPYFLTTSLTNANDVTRKYVYLLSLVSMELLLHEPSNMHKNVSKSEFCNKQPISALTLFFTKFMKAARRTKLCGQEVTKCLKGSEVDSPHHVHSTPSPFWLVFCPNFCHEKCS